MNSSNKLPVEIIGSVEFISLPEHNISDIPARVDTGAIFSSVWASDVKLRSGMLSFKLFASGNTLHTGEVIKTQNFRTAMVKNSFGHSEFRYKVRLTTSIGERNIRAWFTLADRAGMTYPVLIGRNILRNKFVVDVSKHKIKGSTSKPEVLVLASEAKEFVEYFQSVGKFSKKDVQYTVRDYKDLVFSIKPGRVKVKETITNKDIGDFDLVYFKSHKRDYSVAIAAAQYLQFRGVKIVDKELLTQISYDKLSEYIKLALHNIPVPFTYCAQTKYLLKHARELGDKVGWPLVCKEIEADRGRKNYLVDNVEELSDKLKQAEPNDIYVLQTFIPNDGFIRALVFDRDIQLALHRSPIKRDEKEKRHLNKKPYSDNVIKMKLDQLDPQVHDLSIRSAVTMNRQVAGVDILQSTDTKEWFILEVNSAPQVKAGPFQEERTKAVAKFIDEELTR